MLRAVLVSFLAFLLLGPILKLITNEYEKPTWIFLIDSSTSVGEVIDSVGQAKLTATLSEAKEAIENSGYEVKWKDLAGNDLTIVKANV